MELVYPLWYDVPETCVLSSHNTNFSDYVMIGTQALAIYIYIYIYISLQSFVVIFISISPHTSHITANNTKEMNVVWDSSRKGSWHQQRGRMEGEMILNIMFTRTKYREVRVNNTGAPFDVLLLVFRIHTHTHTHTYIYIYILILKKRIKERRRLDSKLYSIRHMFRKKLRADWS